MDLKSLHSALLKIVVIIIIFNSGITVGMDTRFLFQPSSTNFIRDKQVVFSTLQKVAKVNLLTPMYYNKQWISSAWVYSNGYVSLGNEAGRDVIADYPSTSQNVDPVGLLDEKFVTIFGTKNKYGDVTVNQYFGNNITQCWHRLQRDRLKNAIHTLFPRYSNFEPDSIITINWDKMQNENEHDKYNFFELIFLYKGMSTFAVFHYTSINWWMSGEFANLVPRAEVTGGDDMQILIIHRIDDYSAQSDILTMLNTLNNTQIEGEWIIQLAQPDLDYPLSNPVPDKYQKDAAIIQRRAFISDLPIACPIQGIIDENIGTSKYPSVQDSCDQTVCSEPGTMCKVFSSRACCVCSKDYVGNGIICISSTKQLTITVRGTLKITQNDVDEVSQPFQLLMQQVSGRQLQAFLSFTKQSLPVKWAQLMLFLLPFYDVTSSIFAKQIALPQGNTNGTESEHGVSLLSLTGEKCSLTLDINVQSIGIFQLTQIIEFKLPASASTSAQFTIKDGFETHIRILKLNAFPQEEYRLDINANGQSQYSFAYNVVQADRLEIPHRIMKMVPSSEANNGRDQSLEVRFSGEIRFQGNCQINSLIGRQYFVYLGEGKYCRSKCSEKGLCKPFCVSQPEVKAKEPSLCDELKCALQEEECVVIHGKAECQCGIRFERAKNNTCIPKQRVLCDGTLCAVDAFCEKNIRGSWCQCKPGYRVFNHHCVPGKPICGARECGINEECIKIGRESTCVCQLGFIRNQNKCIKEDLMKCGGSCGKNEECSMANDGFLCQCRPGYKKQPFVCEIDECGPCPPNSVCRSGTCHCKTNFVEQSGVCYFRCSLCDRTTTTCLQNGCQCLPGFMPRFTDPNMDNTVCFPEPRCIRMADCPANEICSDGKCLCPYNRTSPGAPCQSPLVPEGPCSQCDPNAECTRIGGQVRCICRPGYESVSEVIGNVCRRAACSCANYPDPQTRECRAGICQCKPGVRSQGKNCLQCSMGSPGGGLGGCHSDAYCTYNAQENFYQCRCREGYAGDGLRCYSKNTCSVCPKNADCVSGECRCRTNFLPLDGVCVWNCALCDKWTTVCAPNSCECRLGYKPIKEEGITTRCQHKLPLTGCYTDSDCPRYEVCRLSKCKCGVRRIEGQCPTPPNGGCSSCPAKTVCSEDGRRCNCLPGFKRNFNGPGADYYPCYADCTLCHPTLGYCNATSGCYCKPPYTGDGVNCRLVNQCDFGEQCGLKSFCDWQDFRRVCQCVPGFVPVGDGPGVIFGKGCRPMKVSIAISPASKIMKKSGDSLTLICKVITEKGEPYVEGGIIWGLMGDRGSPSRPQQTLSYGRTVAGRPGEYLLFFKSLTPEMAGVYECRAANEAKSVTLFVEMNYCPNGCSPNSRCDQIQRRCICEDGFTETRYGTCLQRTCDNFQSMCQPFEICVNASCQCRKGYTRSGTRCEWNGDCSYNQSKCHRFADCNVVFGRYTCQCRKGYVGTGLQCALSDGDCRTHRSCGKNANCRPDPESSVYKCFCNTNYYGNPDEKCSKIINCDTNPQPCGPGSRCVWKSFTHQTSFEVVRGGECECLSGFKLVNSQCIDNKISSLSIYYSMGNAIIKEIIYANRKTDASLFTNETMDDPTSGIFGMGTDCSQPNLLYWTGLRGKSLMVTNITQFSPLKVKNDELYNGKAKGGFSPLFESVAVDWVSGNIFVLDQRAQEIRVFSPVNNVSSVIVKGITDGRSVIVDPNKGQIYWTITSLMLPSLWTSSMDGTNAQRLFNLPAPPIGLTFDPDMRRICWLSARSHRFNWIFAKSQRGYDLLCWFIDGAATSNAIRNIAIIRDIAIDPILIYHDYSFFYAIKNKKEIRHLKNGKTTTISLDFPCCGSSINAFAISSNKCPANYSNGCSRSRNYGNCSHICLPTGYRNSAQCICPDFKVNC